MVNAEIINQMDEVRNCAHMRAFVSEPPVMQLQLNQEKFQRSLICTHLVKHGWHQVAWPTKTTNTLNEQRMHAASSDIMLYIHPSLS